MEIRRWQGSSSGHRSRSKRKALAHHSPKVCWAFLARIRQWCLFFFLVLLNPLAAPWPKQTVEGILEQKSNHIKPWHYFLQHAVQLITAACLYFLPICILECSPFALWNTQEIESALSGPRISSRSQTCFLWDIFLVPQYIWLEELSQQGWLLLRLLWLWFPVICIADT